MNQFPTPNFSGIVLIADRTFKTYDDFEIDSDNLEQIPDLYFDAISGALSTLSPNFTHYLSPGEFALNSHKHKNDFVISIYGGRASRNRVALAPAVCEACGVRYIGSDAYVRLLLQDKRITKEFAKRFGIDSPAGILVERPEQVEELHTLQHPVVVKPNMEGSSIGIDEKSMSHDLENTKAVTLDKLKRYAQPILVEEFIPGREVLICIVGTPTDTLLFEVVEDYHIEDDSYFDKRIYSAEMKMHQDLVRQRIVEDVLAPEDKERMIRLFRSLGKVGYLRIDGRIKDGKFKLIEITPDSHLGTDSAFTTAFRKHGYSYPEMFLKLMSVSYS